MKIFYIINFFCSRETHGVFNKYLTTAKVFKNFFSEVEIIFLKLGVESEAFKNDFKNSEMIFNSENILVSKINYLYKRNFGTAVFKLYKKISGNKNCVVFLDTAVDYMYPWYYIFLNCLKARKIYSFRGLPPHTNLFKYWIDKYGTKLMCDSTERVIIQTSGHTKLYESYLISSKISILGQLFDFSRIKMSNEDFKIAELLKNKIGIGDDNFLSVIFLGRVQYDKGFDILINTADLTRDLPIKFFILGEYHPTLKKVIEEKKIENIFFVGYQRNVKYYINNADVLMHPSRSDGPSNSVGESMLMKKIVIASNVGGISDLIINRHNGFLIDKDNIEEWNKILRYIYENKYSLDYIKENAYKYIATNFNEDAFKKNWSSFMIDFFNNKFKKNYFVPIS
ncbi:MAG TPA: glycosyltransferase [bacterium]|nr:glycosyltransferase [bacterium]HPN29468.1 glycosyltransferase [bacterium]